MEQGSQDEQKAPNTLMNEGVPMLLGGVERLLVMDLNAMAYLEEEFDVNILQDTGFINTADVRVLRVMLWAMIAANDDEFDAPYGTEARRQAIRKVSKWIKPGDLERLGDAITKAMNQAMPEPEEAGVGGNGQHPNRKSRRHGS